MKHPTTLAFALVLVLTAPGSFRPLNADGAAAPPGARVLKVGAHTVTVSLDRHEVQLGQPVKLAMVVDHAKPATGTLTVKVELLERVAEAEARVMPPPVVRESRTVKLQLAAAGRVEHLTFRPRGAARRGTDGRTFIVRLSAAQATPVALAFVARPTRRAGDPEQLAEMVEEGEAAALETGRPSDLLGPDLDALAAGPGPAVPRAAKAMPTALAAPVPAQLETQATRTATLLRPSL